MRRRLPGTSLQSNRLPSRSVTVTTPAASSADGTSTDCDRKNMTASSERALIAISSGPGCVRPARIR